MFETPCTQALWEAVMGKNPSRFPGPERPVEQVSWEDVEDFLTRIAAMIPGLRLGLPTEEQWEYACRAGSAAVRYGDLDTDCLVLREQWRRDPSGRPEATQRLGVSMTCWATCGSGVPTRYREYGTGKSGASAHRVIRGGSWLDVAQGRRARRTAPTASPRTGATALGFRCAEFRTPGPVGRKENRERSERGSRRSGCGAPRRPRHCERSGLDQCRRARNGRRVVRDADAGVT